jgi:hypothetical protein
MGQDHTVPQIVDIHRHIELNGPVRKDGTSVIHHHYLGLKTLAPVVDDIHRGLCREGGGHTQT